jgi:hypothetical protein
VKPKSVSGVLLLTRNVTSPRSPLRAFCSPRSRNQNSKIHTPEFPLAAGLRPAVFGGILPPVQASPGDRAPPGNCTTKGELSAAGATTASNKRIEAFTLGRFVRR